MLDDLAFAVLSMLVLVFAIAARPTRARCPSGMHHEGVRLESGRFDCVRDLVGGRDDIPGEQDTARQPSGVLRGRVMCARPIVVDHRNIGCRSPR